MPEKSSDGPNIRLSSATGATEALPLQHAPNFDHESEAGLSDNAGQDVAIATAEIELSEGLPIFPFLEWFDPDDMAALPTPRSVPTAAYDAGDGDRLAEHYHGHMVQFLSVKTAAWNFYSYIFQTAQKGPDSGLRHGILAWADSHKSWSRQLTPLCPGPYYFKASACLAALLQELATLPIQSMSGPAFVEKLSMVLATSLFLSHCDVMYGDHGSLVTRLNSLKTYLTPRWLALMQVATAVHLRILIWLAYLDLRSTLWRVSRAQPPVDAVAPHKVDNLFDLLRGSSADDSVRQLKDSKYYMVECFGSRYPEQELQDDLSEEPWKLLSDDAMILFCDIKGFQNWHHQVIEHSEPKALYEELRQAKIRALRSDIARIRAECNQIHSEELRLQRHQDYLTRVRSHFLRCTCLHLSATILLNRIVAPDVRTDPESQDAAREIIQITQQLKKAGDLQFPRSIAWPLPMFLAGIEVQDEIYQEWVLNFMHKLEGWGGSVRKATTLLKTIIDKQAEECVRVNPWHVMMDLGEAVMV
ncbi:fungal specific transcription factor domain-containing protein [Purpureocillium lavendulum]|uniref:Fungal specific transcription factor domain-containing protein n=1 Tax=Purpureocillium lavendulum TaxID=1247861 RepID=A0AB34FP22_9HYPO|nr:fungal specific transcription factor domain-containing protein [Purpureocillium lavendulum]